MLRNIKQKLNEIFMTQIVKYGYNHNRYIREYRWYDRSVTDEELKRINEFISMLPFTSCDVLDIGCGDGSLYDVLLEDTCNLTLIDISREMISRAKENISYAEFICDDFLRHDFDKMFGGIVMFYSMYHIPLSKQLTALRKMNRLLFADGVILMNVRRESSNGVKLMTDWCGKKMAWSYDRLPNFLRTCRAAGFKTKVYPSYDNKDYAWVYLTKK